MLGKKTGGFPRSISFEGFSFSLTTLLTERKVSKLSFFCRHRLDESNSRWPSQVLVLWARIKTETCSCCTVVDTSFTLIWKKTTLNFCVRFLTPSASINGREFAGTCKLRAVFRNRHPDDVCAGVVVVSTRYGVPPGIRRLFALRGTSCWAQSAPLAGCGQLFGCLAREKGSIGEDLYAQLGSNWLTSSAQPLVRLEGRACRVCLGFFHEVASYRKRRLRDTVANTFKGHLTLEQSWNWPGEGGGLLLSRIFKEVIAPRAIWYS